METKQAQIFVPIAVILILLFVTLNYDVLPKYLETNVVKSIIENANVEGAPSNRPPNMESHLQFLHPEILQCENIYELGLQKSELQYIWDNVTEYESIVKQQKDKMSRQERANCNEGYSANDSEEAFIMAKLARYVTYILYNCHRAQLTYVYRRRLLGM